MSMSRPGWVVRVLMLKVVWLLDWEMCLFIDYGLNRSMPSGLAPEADHFKFGTFLA